MDRILIATDGSASSDEAVDSGSSSPPTRAPASRSSTSSRRSTSSPRRLWPDGAVPHELTEGDSSSLDEAQARAEAAGVTSYTRLLRGDPADEIVAYADTVDADLIVVGSRGHGALASVLLGSVSRGILREARRPVLVVRAAAARQEAALA